MKKVLFIVRQLLVGIVLLQLLNLSICGQPYWDYYDYSVAHTYDPTETIVEWVVEWKKGNQDAFSYTSNINLKGLNKNFAWHVDMHHHLPSLMPALLSTLSIHAEKISPPPTSTCIEILSPPPEGRHLSI